MFIISLYDLIQLGSLYDLIQLGSLYDLIQLGRHIACEQATSAEEEGGGIDPGQLDMLSKDESAVRV